MAVKKTKRTTKGASPRQRSEGTSSASPGGSAGDTGLRIPDFSQWQQKSAAWRAALGDLIKKGNFTNQAAFCESHRLSPAQFSRVIAGKECPSKGVMAALKVALPDLYEECAESWAKDDLRTTNPAHFVFEIRQRIQLTYPGKAYVISSREFERETDELVRLAADFLDGDPANQLTFILGDSREDWMAFQEEGAVPHYPITYWPLSSRSSVETYLNEVVRYVSAEQRSSCATRLRCIRVSLLKSLRSQARIDDRLRALVASQVLIPFGIWMLYMGRDGEPMAFLFTQLGGKDDWRPLAADGAEALQGYVDLIEAVRTGGGAEVETLPLDQILPVMRRLQVPTASQSEKDSQGVDSDK
jgi:hypothetical protein